MQQAEIEAQVDDGRCRVSRKAPVGRDASRCLGRRAVTAEGRRGDWVGDDIRGVIRDAQARGRRTK